MSVRPKTAVLGRSFQGPGAIRVISAADHRRLAAFAAALPLYTPLHGLNDHLIEQVAVGEGGDWSALLSDHIPARRRQVLQKRYARSRRHLHALRRRYGGRCQVCQWRSPIAAEVCEGHHIHLSLIHISEPTRPY